jgi:hypothetical protein
MLATSETLSVQRELFFATRLDHLEALARYRNGATGSERSGGGSIKLSKRAPSHSNVGYLAPILLLCFRLMRAAAIPEVLGRRAARFANRAGSVFRNI